jgi:cell division control protein 7
LYDQYENDWDIDEKDAMKWASPPLKKQRIGGMSNTSKRARGPKFVAIKKIYVTSSPIRIQNELELLHDLKGSHSVSPLITAFRHEDQVVAILPYFRHTDFRDYFRDMRIPDIRNYFRSLFRALAHVHKHGIVHRDIKPTNFLYEPTKGRGVLVDFGLAEREGTDCSSCMCNQSRDDNRRPYPSALTQLSTGYLKHDTRPSRRANRAGTRGFRAPEVLFKCTNQTTSIDIWSAGVILLTILSKRFPFFNSADDVEALIEIATIFGKHRMRLCAQIHGSVFETTIPTIGEKGFTLEKIVMWSTNRSAKGDESENMSRGEAEAIKFMKKCFELDPAKRISADDALNHEFLAEEWSEEVDEDEMSLV